MKKYYIIGNKYFLELSSIKDDLLLEMKETALMNKLIKESIQLGNLILKDSIEGVNKNLDEYNFKRMEVEVLSYKMLQNIKERKEYV